MSSEIDVRRSVHLMIQQHGDDAVIEASMKADQILGRGKIKLGSGPIKGIPSGA